MSYLVRYNKLHELMELPTEDSVISELSGGQQRRMSLAVSLVGNHSLVILDEPTVGIDLLITKKIWQYLNERCRDGLTILFVTHYIEEAINAQKIGLLRNGRLLAEDSPQSLLENFNEDSLESVFLKLCILDEKAFDNNREDSIKSFDPKECQNGMCHTLNDNEENCEDESIEHKSWFDSLFFNIWIVLVLMERNLLKYFHMNSAIICILLPATQVLTTLHITRLTIQGRDLMIEFHYSS